EFWFTTNADYSKKVIPLVETIEKLKQNQEINDNILYVFFNNNIDDMSLKLETLRILEIHWNFFSFLNHLNPVKRIKDKCLELLDDFKNELINTPENVILSLYDCISEFSSKPSEQNNFTKTVFS
ncbi:unnamed protein product, partial [marine sediment metagenome]